MSAWHYKHRTIIRNCKSCIYSTHSIPVPTWQFVALADSDVYVYDNSKSVIRSLSDVVNDAMYFSMEENFTGDAKLTNTVKMSIEGECKERRPDVISSCSFQQLHCDLSSNTTFLSCSNELSAKLPCLCLLASRMKALAKVVTRRTNVIESQLFAMAVYSTQLRKVYKHSVGPRKLCKCDLLLSDICISCGLGETKKAAKSSARSNAVKLLLTSYLHVEQNLSCETH